MPPLQAADSSITATPTRRGGQSLVKYLGANTSRAVLSNALNVIIPFIRSKEILGYLLYRRIPSSEAAPGSKPPFSISTKCFYLRSSIIATSTFFNIAKSTVGGGWEKKDTIIKGMLHL